MKATKILNKLARLANDFKELPQQITNLQQAVGRIEKRQLAITNSTSLHEQEFKVYSQNGEDGIIQFIIRNIQILNPVFVEFGVHRYTESNTRFLLKNNNWSGLVIDGSSKNISFIKSDPIYWQHNLKAECAFISKDNINDLILRNGLSGDIGLLSIDIDGNDYWVWEAIDCINPRIVVCEYNALFGDTAKVSVPYDANFVYSIAHYSTLYWGASIGAFNYLAEKKGYALIGANSSGNNIFFVRHDVLGNIRKRSVKEAYVQSQFRTSRDRNCELTFLDTSEGLRLISDLALADVETQEILKVGDIQAETVKAFESYASLS